MATKHTTVYHIPAGYTGPDPTEPPLIVASTGIATVPDNPTTPQRKNRIWPWILGGVAFLILVIILLVVFLTPASSSEEDDDFLPTSAPTISGDEECLNKRIRITEICDIPDLDGDWFDDNSMEIQVLVNDESYWPKQVETDCLEEYGSDGQIACNVPDSTVMNGSCFTLRNSIELAFGVDGASIEENLKITIIDRDIFSDELIDIFAPIEDWYRPNVCEKKTFEFFESNNGARIKMVVDFGDVENPCGVEEEILVAGLNDAATELENIQLALLEYVSENQTERRRLIFPLLASGFRALTAGVGRFAGLFTRSSGASNALSKIADLTQIGSMIFSIFGDDDESGNKEDTNNQALFDQVFDRFDQIDNQLDNIQLQIQDGFKAIELVIQEEFAKQELDEWITFRLGIKLRGDYAGYMDKSHTALSRPIYEETFRETCNGDYSPYSIFQVLYSHACLDCERFSGKAQQYFLDTYVDLANANFVEDPKERVLWFRKSFGTVIIGALTEAIYFYSVCLYRPSDECEVVDPVWDARLEEMGNALEEVLDSLGEAEIRLE